MKRISFLDIVLFLFGAVVGTAIYCLVLFLASS